MIETTSALVFDPAQFWGRTVLARCLDQRTRGPSSDRSAASGLGPKDRERGETNSKHEGRDVHPTDRSRLRTATAPPRAPSPRIKAVLQAQGLSLGRDEEIWRRPIASR